MRAINSVRGAAPCALALFLFGILASNAHAGLLLPANQVVYENVLTQSVLDPSRNFGPASITGNSLQYTDMNCYASVYDSAGGSNTAGNTLSFSVVAKAGYGIESFSVTESGGMFVPESGDSYVKAAMVPSSFFILQVDGEDLLQPLSITPTVSFTGLTPIAGQPGYGKAVAGAGAAWGANLEVNLAAALLAEGIEGHVTKASFSMTNYLNAYATAGSQAAITKTALTVNVGAAAVPEPGTWALMGLGAVGAVVLARRKRR